MSEVNKKVYPSTFDFISGGGVKNEKKVKARE